MSTTTDPKPLAPLGSETDAYWYANGVIAYYRGDGLVHIHASATERACVLPTNAWAVIVAVALVMGLTNDEAALLAEACESYGNKPVPYRVVPTDYV